MKIKHLAMYVNDLEAIKDFFITFFGASSNTTIQRLDWKLISYHLKIVQD